MRYTILLLTLWMAVNIQAQDPSEWYVQVDYMKPYEGKSADYVAMEQEVYKPIHRERIKSGEIIAWYLYQVRYPSGSGTEYDYCTVTVFSNFASIDDNIEEYGSVVLRAHPDKTLEQVEKYATDTRELVRSDVFKSVANIPERVETPAQSILVDYMKVEPSQESHYLRMEEQIWKPLHSERLARGVITDWGLYELLFPGGLNYPYTHCTVTGFKQWQDISDSWPDDIWKAVHPSATQEDLEERAHEVRDLVSSQIWKLIDHVRLSDL
ncbi:MAG: hypothetical protein R3330_01835 [Saprospiraceae bacterium]|nr:hypothetical protein [Saprospiraceae bacterium]